MAGWKKPPPVIVLSGSEGFLRRREIKKAVAAARETGRTVERVTGEDHNVISELLEGEMFGGATLVLVTNPGKIDPVLVTRLLEEGDGTVCMVLHNEGKIRKGSKLDKLDIPKKCCIVFNRPDQAYKVKDYAVKFVVNEAHRFGLVISGGLAEALVSKVGTNLGVLHFELLKVEAYMAAEGAGTTVAPKLLMATMVRTGEADLAPLVDAVGRRDVRKLLREMTQLRVNFAGKESGRTLAACAWLGSAATRWLHAASLHEDGATADEAGSRMKMHAYVYKSFNLPIAKRWGRARLITLVKRISRVEMAVRSGHISPWIELECVLAATCRPASTPG